MVDSNTEIAVSPDAIALKNELKKLDSEIVARKQELKKRARRTIEEIARPILGKSSLGYGATTPEQAEVLMGVVLDAVATLKIGRTSQDEIRDGMRNGKQIKIDPLMDGWKERIKRSGIRNIDDAFQHTQDAAVAVINKVPHVDKI